MLRRVKINWFPADNPLPRIRHFYHFPLDNKTNLSYTRCSIQLPLECDRMEATGSQQPYTIEPQSLAGFDVAISHMRRRPGAVHLLYGHSLVYTVSLLIGSAVNQPLAVVDGAMKFNSYTLSKIAALLGIPPKALLRKTHVTRSFTAFQTEA